MCLGLDQRYRGVSLCVQGQIRDREFFPCASRVRLEIQRGFSVRLRLDLRYGVFFFFFVCVCLGLDQGQRWVPRCVLGLIGDMEGFLYVSRVRSELWRGFSMFLGLDRSYGGVSLCVQDQVRDIERFLCEPRVRWESELLGALSPVNHRELHQGCQMREMEGFL